MDDVIRFALWRDFLQFTLGQLLEAGNTIDPVSLTNQTDFAPTRLAEILEAMVATGKAERVGDLTASWQRPDGRLEVFYFYRRARGRCRDCRHWTGGRSEASFFPPQWGGCKMHEQEAGSPMSMHLTVLPWVVNPEYGGNVETAHYVGGELTDGVKMMIPAIETEVGDSMYLTFYEGFGCPLFDKK